MRARSSEGVWGPWSRVFSFSARAPAVPLDVTAHFDPAARTVTLRWERGKGGATPVRYLIFGSTEQGFTASAEPYRYNAGKDGIKNASANLLLETKTSVTSWKIPTPLWRPYYRVAAVDEAGHQSESSDMAHLNHPLVLTRQLPEADTGADYHARIGVSASIGHLVYRESKSGEVNSFQGGDELAFAVTGAPPGLAIDKNTGLLAGFLPAKAAGRYKIKISVSDQRTGANDSVELVLRVRKKRQGTSAGPP